MLEKTEIMADLANAMAEIVEKRVNANKPTIDDSVKMILDSLQMGSHSNGITQASFNEIVKVARQNGFEIGDENEYAMAEKDTILERADKLIYENEATTDDCETLIETIKNSDVGSDAFESAARAWVNDNDDFVDKDDIDEDWAFENLDNDVLRSIAKRYVEENL